MNLRIQSGFAHFRPTLDAFSQYHSGSTCRQADLCTSDFNCILHRTFKPELRFHRGGVDLIRLGQ